MHTVRSTSCSYIACENSNTNNSVPNQTATLITDGGAAGGGQNIIQGAIELLDKPMGQPATAPYHHISRFAAGSNSRHLGVSSRGKRE